MACMNPMNPPSYLPHPQAVATAALLARQGAGKVTVLVVDEPGTLAQSPQLRIDTITW